MYRPCVFSILTPLCHITFFVLRHSNSYCVNFVRISKNTVPYVPPEIFAAILRLFSDFCGYFAAIFGSNLALISKNGYQLFGHKKKRETPLFMEFSHVFYFGCPDGLEPSTFRTTI